jgi:hypothetical protein
MANQNNENENPEEKAKYFESLRQNVNNSIIENYENMKLILDRLLTMSCFINNYTLAHILIHVPPESFFVYSSYTKALDKFISCYTSDCEYNDNKARHSYDKELIGIIRLNPNINIPLSFMTCIFIKKDLAAIIDGLRIGFARYALHTINKIHESISMCSVPDEEYLKSSYIEKLNYIVNEAGTFYSDNSSETGEELENDSEYPKPLLAAADFRQSRTYTELDLKGILERTNKYINDLTELLTAAEAIEGEETPDKA